MLTLEDIIDEFAERASEQELEKFETQKTFTEALQILRQYSTSYFGIGDNDFIFALTTSMLNYNGAKETKDDVWLLMVTLKDAKPPDSFKSLDHPTERFGSEKGEEEDGEDEEERESFSRIEKARLHQMGGFRRCTGLLCCLLCPCLYLKWSLSRTGTLEGLCLERGSEQYGYEARPQVIAIDGFGVIRPGIGKLAPMVTTSTAYFSNEGRTYKARLKGGKLQFVRYPAVKAILSSINSFGIPGFSVSWKMNFAETPANQILSTIFKEGSSAMIDWVMALIYSRDVRISKTSSCAGYVPASLVDSDEEGMCLTQPIRKEYFADRKFLYNEESKELFWVPCGGVLHMKVIVQDGLYNSFQRIHIGNRREASIHQLQDRIAAELEKDFV